MTITGGVKTSATLSTAITSYDPSTAGLSSYQTQLNLNPYVNIP